MTGINRMCWACGNYTSPYERWIIKTEGLCTTCHEGRLRGISTIEEAKKNNTITTKEAQTNEHTSQTSHLSI
jgi:hypothetical protein